MKRAGLTAKYSRRAKNIIFIVESYDLVVSHEVGRCKDCVEVFGAVHDKSALIVACFGESFVIDVTRKNHFVSIEKGGRSL